MAGSSFGNLFRITTWGESHGKGIGVVVDLSLIHIWFPEVTSAEYLLRYPVVTFGSLGCHFARRAAISSSETSTFNVISGILIFMISPSSTRAIGPPTAASGETCPMRCV